MLPRERVETDMRRRLQAGEWPPGGQLPTVAQLAEHYETSTATVSKALARLRDDGLITVIPNWGSFAAEEPGNADG